VIEALAEKIHDVRWQALGLPAQRKLLLCLLANLAVGVAGRSALRMPRPAPGEGHLLLDGGQTGQARDAAFFNAALMHARTQDDFHPIGNLHLATVIVPALMAQAEACGDITGEVFLDAMAAGYACGTGLSARYSALGTPRGLRSTSLYASMAAAAAVARLRGQDARGIGNTLALASQSAFGTTQCWRDGSDEYQLQVGMGASQALMCAFWTEAGVRGGSGALTGPSGFYQALLGQVLPFDDIAPDFDADKAILQTVLKRYPVSGICQPLVLLAERLVLAVAGRPVESVRIEMNDYEMNYPGTLNAGPSFRSFSDRLMSARFCVASVLDKGCFDFDAFVAPVSPELLGLLARIDVSAGKGLGTLSCRMSIRLQGGDLVEGEVHEGGGQLTIDWSSIDRWCAGLWTQAGRTQAYGDRLRQAVERLPDGKFAALRAALLAEGATP
jgi:2-methylcitrate dehydratase PrpD